MTDVMFYFLIALLEMLRAIEAWRIKHRRFCLLYALAACLTLAYAAAHLTWTGPPPVPDIWI